MSSATRNVPTHLWTTDEIIEIAAEASRARGTSVDQLGATEYFLLTKLVDVLDGGVSDAFDRRIVEPLGLEGTSYPGSLMPEGLAAGWLPDLGFQGQQDIGGMDRISTFRTTAPDLARFLQAYLVGVVSSDLAAEVFSDEVGPLTLGASSSPPTWTTPAGRSSARSAVIIPATAIEVVVDPRTRGTSPSCSPTTPRSIHHPVAAAIVKAWGADGSCDAGWIRRCNVRNPFDRAAEERYETSNPPSQNGGNKRCSTRHPGARQGVHQGHGGDHHRDPQHRPARKHGRRRCRRTRRQNAAAGALAATAGDLRLLDEPRTQRTSLSIPRARRRLALETPIYFTWVNGAWPQLTKVPSTGHRQPYRTIWGKRPDHCQRPALRLDRLGQHQRQAGSEEYSKAIIETHFAYRIVDALGYTLDWCQHIRDLHSPAQVAAGTDRSPFSACPLRHGPRDLIGSGHGPCEGLTMWTSGDYLNDPSGQTVIIGEPVPPTPDVPDAALAIAG